MRKEMVKEIQLKVATAPLEFLKITRKDLREMINVYNLSYTLFKQTFPLNKYTLEELRFYYLLVNKQLRLLKSLTN